MTHPRIDLLGPESAEVAAEAGVPGYFADVNLYRALLNHPRLAKQIADLVVTLWRDATLNARLRELIIMRVAWCTSCSYEWAHHWSMALKAGLTADEAAAIRDWPNTKLFGPADNAVLAAVDEIIESGAISGPVWTLLAEHVGENQVILEVIATISTWRMVSELLRSMDVPLEEGFDAWTPDGVDPASYIYGATR